MHKQWSRPYCSNGLEKASNALIIMKIKYSRRTVKQGAVSSCAAANFAYNCVRAVTVQAGPVGPPSWCPPTRPQKRLEEAL